MTFSNDSGTQTTVAVLVAATLLASLVLGPVAASATGEDITFVESPITTDTTWTPTEGPYRIIQDVDVAPGATLTIEPGTTVQLAERITVTVRGSLYANGTAAERVTIARSAGAAPDRRWASIRYDGNEASRLALRNTTLTGGVEGVTVASSEGSIAVVDSAMRDFTTAAVSVGSVTATPSITIDGSTIEAIGGHAIRASPGLGATDEVTLEAAPDDRSERSIHTLSLHPGVGVSTDTIALRYPSASNVANVTPESVRRLGIDPDRDGLVDRPLFQYVQNVSTTGDRIRVSFNRTVRIRSSDRLLLEYDDVVNPETRGIYPVDVSLLEGGVPQLSDGVRAEYAVGGVTAPFRPSEPTPTRVRGLTVRQSQFRDVAGTSVFVAADRVTGLRVVGTRVDETSGSGVAVRAKRSESSFWYNDLAATEAGIAVEALSRTTLTGYENRISGGETGIRIRQSSARLRQPANVTLRRNTISNTAGHGVDVTTRTVEVDLRATKNTLRDTGRDGIHLSNWILRRGTIEGNRITDSGDDGLSVDGSLVANAAIADNEITASGGDGLAIHTRAAARRLAIRNNTLTDGRGHGLAVQTDLVVENLTIDANRLANNAGAGLLVSSPVTHSGTAVATNNVVGANAYGIVVRGIVETTVRNNDVVFNTNAFAEPVPLAGVTPGTGIYVAEGPAGVIVNQANAEIPLEDLVANPSLNQELTIARLWDDTVIVLRSDAASEARAAEASALTIRRVGESLPTGIAIPKTGSANDTVRIVRNDVYGQERGLTVDVETLIAANTTARILTDQIRTVHAEANYWGSDGGPYHGSILPEGEGNAVVTKQGWADFVPFRTEPHGPRYARPTPRVDVPATAAPDREVELSGTASTTESVSGPVTRYRYVVDGTAQPVQSTPSRVVVMPDARLSVTLAVEDALGIDSGNATTGTIDRQTEPTSTATATARPTTGPGTPTAVSPAPGSEPTVLGSLGSFWGVVGAAFYLAALLLGGYGMALTFRNRAPPVDGLQIQALAGVGVLVWVVTGLLGPGPLVGVGIAGALSWGVLTGVAYVLAR
ncbi:right-handed parallel beta-helix repeat-containing protein [Halobellus sp. Atlit-31R]|nr:right-handed parallel beta-helix repeat-containing protein [Halobellus sp. Atlit-31R]